MTTNSKQSHWADRFPAPDSAQWSRRFLTWQLLADTVEKVVDLIPTWSVLKSVCDRGIFGDELSQFHPKCSRM